jgi:uncharacterized membrane protein
VSGISAFLGLFCHQLPERSPIFHDTIVFPLCFRCAGLYIGFLCGYLSLGLRGGLRRGFPSLGVAVTASFSVVPLWFDGWGNFLHLWSSPGWLRGLTGLTAGAVLPFVILPLVQPVSRISALELKATISRPSGLLWPFLLGLPALRLLIEPAFPFSFDLLTLAAGSGLALFLGNFAIAAIQLVWRDNRNIEGTDGPYLYKLFTTGLRLRG